MWVKKRKKRDSRILDSLLTFAVILIFLGVTTAQAEEKTVFKIQKDKKKVTEPSKKPVEEKVKTDSIEEEIKAKKDREKAAYSYNPTNKIDPFKSFIIVKKELEKKERAKTYLETLDISQLTISAIVLGSKGNWALVRDSKGDGHVIKIGTLIGKKSGQVIKILEKEVVVRESYKDIRGREIIRDVSMKLPSID